MPGFIVKPTLPHLDLSPGPMKIGGVSAKILAESYGTPLYVTDLDRISERYDSALASLVERHPNILIAFAYKANSTLDIVKALARKGAGATIVSGAGVSLADACGVNPGKVVFDGPSKSKEELALAIRSGVGMINAESTQEILDIESLCQQLDVKDCRVGFRVNFGIQAETHPGLATGSRAHKFGIPKVEILRFSKKEAPKLGHVRLAGLHSHVGSQITDLSVFRTLTSEMVRFAAELRQKCGLVIEEFNFGGGLGVGYEPHAKVTDFAGYAEATAGIFARLWMGGERNGIRLVFELGRSLVADSTILLTRVNYLKKAGRTTWVLVDAGMNDFLRPALYGAYHEIVPAHVARKGSTGVSYSIGGPVCESTDVFGVRRKLGVELSQGDVLAILDAGAYGISMASHYNMRSLPPVVVISKGRHHLAAIGEDYHSDVVKGRRFRG